MNPAAYLVAAAGMFLSPAPSDTGKYASKDGGYLVAFPPSDDPVRRIRIETPTGSGDKVTVYIARRDFKGGTCLAAYSDYTAEAVLQADPEAEAEAVADGLLGGLKAKELSLTRIKVLGRTARELAFEMPGGLGRGKARVFYVKNRLYQLIIYDAEPDSKAVDAFLDSFELLKAAK